MAAISLSMRSKWQPQDGEVGPHDALAALADRQHGVVSIRQLEARLGYSHSAISRATASGRIHRLYTSVYAVGHTNLSLHGQCLAAVLACGPRALLSHYSAAWLLGLASTQPVPIHVTSPVQRRNRRPIRIHRSRTLTDEDRALEGVIPVTSVPRTLLDMAAVVKPDWLRRILERSEELGLFELGPVESVIARNRGHRGSARLRRAIAGYQPPVFTRSDAERYLLDLLKKRWPATPRDRVQRAWPRARLLLARAPLRGRTRPLRDARDAGGVRARPAARRGPGARRHRDDPRHRPPSRTRTGAGDRADLAAVGAGQR